MRKGYRRQRACTLAMRLLATLALCLTHTTGNAAEPPPTSVAFWYADTPPLAELAQFDWAVVEPGHLSAQNVTTLRKLGGKPFAYLSVGEFHGDQAALARLALSQATSSTRNNAWNSQVMDLTTPAWRNHLFERARQLQAQGYAGLFLDTLDSFQLLPQGDREPQRRALASFLRELHKREPALKLFFNRGFEVLPELEGVAAAVAVESIHAGWDAAAKRYRAVPQADRDWLEGQLAPLKAKGIPVVAIDYLPPAERERARKLARQLREEGFIPFVTTPELNYLGVSALEVQPRRIAMLYDAREGDLTTNVGHTTLGGLLEYLGYRVDYFPVGQAPLPEYRLKGLYAGVVTWMTTGPPDDSKALNDWLGKQLDEQVPLAFLEGLPVVNSGLLQRLGLKLSPQENLPPLHLVDHDASLLGAFEAPMRLMHEQMSGISLLPGGPKAAVNLEDEQGQVYSPVAIGSWGDIALAPYVIESNSERRRWLLDPFAFVQRALGLPAMPRPDTTTENGRRIATVHIDGDGFPSRAETPGTPYAGQEVLDAFIQPHPFLTSVSVIEGELSARGAFPFLSKDLEPIARKIFANPKVEVASHTYSHPFFMQPDQARKRGSVDAEYGENMKIAGYKEIDFRREVFGSRDYINSRLTTPEKPVKLMFWPGDALPGASTIQLAYEAGLQNVNGGETKLTMSNPSLTGLSPLLRPTEGGLQYYAPVINENVFTNLWHGPYYGFRDVVDTFKLTDSPRRLRGLHLYYHFYSATKQASLKVMDDIYGYMTSQQPMSLWMSDYLTRLHGLHQSSLARTAEGDWQVRGLDGLRTLRLDPEMGWPDLGRSEGVAGVRDLPQGRYVHLSADRALLALRPDRDPRPALEEANLPLSQWRYVDDHQVVFSFAGETALQFSVRSSAACRVQVQDRRFAGEPAQGLWLFKLPMKQVRDAQLFCG